MDDLLMRGIAVISSCESYRWELRRIWEDTRPPMLLGMLNPSTADAAINDPTVRRGISFGERAGCGSLIVVNLGAGRATEPKNWMAMSDPIGPQNDVYIRAALHEVWARQGIAVAAWGALGGFMNRDKAFLKMAKDEGVDLVCLGKTKDGHPRHPLYVRGDQPFIAYP